MTNSCCHQPASDTSTAKQETGCCNNASDKNTSGTCGSACQNMMTCCQPNLGTTDRVIRGLMGIGLIALVFIGPQTAWGWLGLLPLASALFGWCGMYKILGIQTKKGTCCTPTPKTD